MNVNNAVQGGPNLLNGPGSGTGAGRRRGGPGGGHRKEVFQKLAKAVQSGDAKAVGQLLKEHPRLAQKLAQKLQENGGQLPRLEARAPGASKMVAAALQGGGAG